MEKIQNTFEHRKPEIIGDFKKSGVMILLSEEGKKINIIFEVRSLKLKSQPGDICLPGGKVEDGESPKEAAIRETMEELNLERDKIQFIGSMDYVVTPYNFIMYPFVSKINESQIVPNRAEVDHVFKVPIDFFLENSPKLYELPIISDPNKDFPYDLIANGKNYKFRTGKVPEYFYQYENYVIWGFTALIIKRFTDIMYPHLKS
jgi:8-oxo-dGTP pyrophosphatase MutT (NUDIX family)